MRIKVAVLAAALVPLCAQQIRLPESLEALSEKAEESVNVTLDGAMLQFAAKWLSDTGEDAKVKKLLANLQGIYVRSFEFAGESEYSKADVDAFRDQFRAPGWSRIVGAHSKRNSGDADIYIKTDPNGTIGGIVVIATEAKQLTIVNIAGTLDPAQLADLGGRFHIPVLDLACCSHEWRESR